MFDKEAERLRELLLGLASASPILNIGSSTRAFREIEKPHIDRLLFAPLCAAGIETIHSDLKAADGVDVPGDIFDPSVFARLKALKVGCVLISNVLEHVRDPALLARRCEEIAGPGGYILASVPFSYPYHADPLDSGYRPSPKALAALFSQSDCVACEVVDGRTYAEDVAARGSNLWREALRTLLLTPVFFLRPRSWRSRVHRWLWLRRPYRVSVALLRVRS
jgi:hypothetical protein